MVLPQLPKLMTYYPPQKKTFTIKSQMTSLGRQPTLIGLNKRAAIETWQTKSNIERGQLKNSST